MTFCIHEWFRSINIFADYNNQLQKCILAAETGNNSRFTAWVLYGLNFNNFVTRWTEILDTPTCWNNRCKDLRGFCSNGKPISFKVSSIYYLNRICLFTFFTSLYIVMLFDTGKREIYDEFSATPLLAELFGAKICEGNLLIGNLFHLKFPLLRPVSSLAPYFNRVCLS